MPGAHWVGGRVTPPVRPHHRAYGSVHGGSSAPLQIPELSQKVQESPHRKHDCSRPHACARPPRSTKRLVRWRWPCAHAQPRVPVRPFEHPRPTAGLGQSHLAHRRWNVGRVQQLLSDGVPLRTEIGWEVFDTHAVDTRCPLVGLHTFQGCSQVLSPQHLLQQRLGLWSDRVRARRCRLTHESRLMATSGRLLPGSLGRLSSHDCASVGTRDHGIGPGSLVRASGRCDDPSALC